MFVRIFSHMQLTRPHHHDDWLGVYQTAGTGPRGCALRQAVPMDANEGTVHFVQVCYIVLQCVVVFVVCCSVLQCVSVCFGVLQRSVL